MTGFSAEWLALREPFDREARRAATGSVDLPALAARKRRDDPVLAVLDLGCGTGANLRELAPRLGGPQRWTLVDHDPALLDALPGALNEWARHNQYASGPKGKPLRIAGPGWSAEVEWLRADLAAALDQLPFAQSHLVTASALLDLGSSHWLDGLLERARRADAALWFALTVDGLVEWSPPIADDEDIHRLFAVHQRRDKGFGAALGGTAVEVAAGRLAGVGYEVHEAASDWHIDGSEGGPAAAMLRAMVQGMGAAAAEQSPDEAARIGGWTKRRLSLIGRTRLRVGHRELVAVPRRS
jgi:SAM-dependent methyltransferase